MPKKPTLEELAARNPSADIAKVRRSIEATEALREVGVKPQGYTLRTAGGHHIPTTPKQRVRRRYFNFKTPKSA